MPFKNEQDTRLEKGTIVGKVPCEGCANLGSEKEVDITVGKSGKLFAYCKQERKPGPKNACGWRMYFPAAVSYKMTSDYINGQTVNIETEGADHGEENNDIEEREPEAGDDNGDDSGDSDERKPGFTNWFDN